MCQIGYALFVYQSKMRERKLDDQVFISSKKLLPSWIINISITRPAKLLDTHFLDIAKSKKKKHACNSLFRLNFVYIIILHIYFNTVVNPFTLRIFYEFGYALKSNYSLMRSVSFLKGSGK